MSDPDVIAISSAGEVVNVASKDDFGPAMNAILKPLNDKINYLLSHPSRGSSSGSASRMCASFYFEATLVPGTLFGLFTFSGQRTIVRIEADLREKTDGAPAVFEVYLAGAASGSTVVVPDGQVSGTSDVSHPVPDGTAMAIMCVSAGSAYPGSGAFLNVYYT